MIVTVKTYFDLDLNLQGEDLRSTISKLHEEVVSNIHRSHPFRKGYTISTEPNGLVVICKALPQSEALQTLKTSTSKK